MVGPLTRRSCVAFACAAAASAALCCGGAGSAGVGDAWSAADRAAVPGLDGRGPPVADRDRVEPSALYSRAGGVWWRTRFRAGTSSVLLLSGEVTPGVEHPLAAVVWTAGDPVAQLHLGSGCAELSADQLERLYGLLLGLPAELQLRVLGPRGATMTDQRAPQTTSTMLRRVGLARVALNGPGVAAGPSWQIADVAPRFDGDQPLRVSVRVSDPGGAPLAGVPVSFKRQPHLACWAVTDVEGTAECELQDEHDHVHPYESGGVPPVTMVALARSVAGSVQYAPQHVIFGTPAPARCLSSVVAPEVAAMWPANCRGFAPKAWDWPVSQRQRSSNPD